MQKIIPHLWFDKEAREAAEFYATAFPEAKVIRSTVLHGTPSGDAETVTFEIGGTRFMAISAGPYFKPNPAISFMVTFHPKERPDAREVLDALWSKLAEGGKELMPLQAYPFSERYGWIEDRFGVSWQLILSNPEDEHRPLVMPSLLFTKDLSGKAEEATDFYLSLFEGSRRASIARYPTEMGAALEGHVMYTDLQLAGQWLVAMDGGDEHAFSFTEGVSLLVQCADQAEIDRLWERLSAVPEAEQCGWLKDRYGVSWQIAPAAMERMMSEGTPEQVARVTQAFLGMKKFDIATLEKAYAGE